VSQPNEPAFALKCASGRLTFRAVHRAVQVVNRVTDQCVDHTVRDAADRGFYPIRISDACATHSKARQVNALAAFAGYCQTLTTQEMIGLATRSSSARE